MVKIAEIKLANAELAQFISFFLERIDKIHQDKNYYTDFFDDSIEHPTLEDKKFSIGAPRCFMWVSHNSDYQR